MKLTPFSEFEQVEKSQFIEFAGYKLPLYFDSIITEAKETRKICGFFNISHMGRLSLKGTDAMELINLFVTRNVENIQNFRGIYTLFLNERGGIIDDIIVFKINETEFFVVCNCINREKNIRWINFWIDKKGLKAELYDLTDSTLSFALQGPTSSERICDVVGDLFPDTNLKNIKRFWCVKNNDLFISRTGYTGEDGFEVSLPREYAGKIFAKIKRNAIKLCGLGARDILRLEAGFALWGQDIDERTTPLGSHLEKFVDLSKDFIGREMMFETFEKNKSYLMPLLLDSGIPRSNYMVLKNGEPVGRVTSGNFSPHLEKGIAFIRCSVKFQEGESLTVSDKKRKFLGKIVNLPFLKS